MAKATRHSPPKFLPAEVKAKWNGLYDAALKTAKTNHPDDERAQHVAANKEANKLLTVPAPESAKDIDALEEWQVLPGTRKTALIDGVEHTVAVTIDGRKYAHPTPPKKGAETKAK